MKGRSHRRVGAVNQLSHPHTELESEESLSNVLSAPVISRSDELNTQKDFISGDSDSAGSSPGDEWTCDLAGKETSVVGSGSSLWRESSEEQGSKGEGSVGQGSAGQGRGGGESLLEREAHSVLLSLCQGVVDVAYKQPKGAPNASTRNSGPQVHVASITVSSMIISSPSPRQAFPYTFLHSTILKCVNEARHYQFYKYHFPQIKTLSVQPKRRLHAHSVRQTPLYHNCRLLAPDGSLLSVMDHKKIQWYLDRHLGSEQRCLLPKLSFHLKLPPFLAGSHVDSENNYYYLFYESFL